MPIFSRVWIVVHFLLFFGMAREHSAEHDRGGKWPNGCALFCRYHAKIVGKYGDEKYTQAYFLPRQKIQFDTWFFSSIFFSLHGFSIFVAFALAFRFPHYFLMFLVFSRLYFHISMFPHIKFPFFRISIFAYPYSDISCCNSIFFTFFPRHFMISIIFCLSLVTVRVGILCRHSLYRAQLAW